MRRIMMLGLASLVVSCGSDGPVETRGCNATGYALDSLSIGAFEGPLAIGACTPFEQHAKAYRSTFVHFVIGQDDFVFQPIDHVGETPLSSGDWSYVITIVDYANREMGVEAVAND